MGPTMTDCSHHCPRAASPVRVVWRVIKLPSRTAKPRRRPACATTIAFKFRRVGSFTSDMSQHEHDASHDGAHIVHHEKRERPMHTDPAFWCDSTNRGRLRPVAKKTMAGRISANLEPLPLSEHRPLQTKGAKAWSRVQPIGDESHEDAHLREFRRKMRRGFSLLREASRGKGRHDDDARTGT